jgi:cell division protein FtsB
LQETIDAEAQNSDSLDSQKSEKEILLEEIEKERRRAKNITFRELLYIYLIIFIALAVILPKIYFANQVYYTSKEINSLYHKYTALKEEKAALLREIEALKYRINVQDELPSDNEEESGLDQK